MKKVLLVLMAFLVLLLAAGADHANMLLDSKAVVAVDQSDQDSDDASIPFYHEITANIFNSVVNIPHLVFHSDLVFEFELPEIQETKAHSVILTALNFTKLYRTLFQRIISPNAP